MNKKIMILLALILISVIAIAQSQIVAVDKTRDIPSPLSPAFVKQIEDCGKLDLIDRSSVNYNPNALVDGSLAECDN